MRGGFARLGNLDAELRAQVGDLGGRSATGEEGRGNSLIWDLGFGILKIFILLIFYRAQRRSDLNRPYL